MIMLEEYQECQLKVSYEEDDLLNHMLGAEERKDDFSGASELDDSAPKPREITEKKKGRSKVEKHPKEFQKKVRQKVVDQKTRKGHWFLEENKRYHWFLEIYHKHFLCKELRRLDKIFKTMAVFIGTREAEQCRSHHQKMEKKYHNFSNILLFLRHSHYDSSETQPILEDMSRYQVQSEQELIEERELLSINSTKEREDEDKKVTHEQKVSEAELSNAFNFEGANPVHPFEDILSDKYQHILYLDNSII